jgi:hypothetical protein
MIAGQQCCTRAAARSWLARARWTSRTARRGSRWARAANPKLRPSLDSLLRDEVIPAFKRYSVLAAGALRNNWIGTTVIGNYGDGAAIRTAANYVGIWANARHEVIYFVTTRDAAGEPLDGADSYVTAPRRAGAPVVGSPSVSDRAPPRPVSGSAVTTILGPTLSATR